MSALRKALAAFVSMVVLDLAITLYALELRSGYVEANALPAALVDAFGVWGLFVPPVLAVTLVLLVVRGIGVVREESLRERVHWPVVGATVTYVFILSRNVAVLVG